jgi:hypothetical protein
LNAVPNVLGLPNILLAHFPLQDHIIPQIKKDDDNTQAVIIHEEAAKPFFSWPFGGQTAPDSSENKEIQTTSQQSTATEEPLTQAVRIQ